MGERALPPLALSVRARCSSWSLRHSHWRPVRSDESGPRLALGGGAVDVEVETDLATCHPGRHRRCVDRRHLMTSCPMMGLTWRGRDALANCLDASTLSALPLKQGVEPSQKRRRASAHPLLLLLIARFVVTRVRQSCSDVSCGAPSAPAVHRGTTTRDERPSMRRERSLRSRLESAGSGSRAGTLEQFRANAINACRTNSGIVHSPRNVFITPSLFSRSQTMMPV